MVFVLHLIGRKSGERFFEPIGWRRNSKSYYHSTQPKTALLKGDSILRKIELSISLTRRRFWKYANDEKKKKKEKAKDCNSMQAKITAINTLPLNREKKL